ncbi:hypothetical protein Emed_003849 [Eimeria media]
MGGPPPHQGPPLPPRFPLFVAGGLSILGFLLFFVYLFVHLRRKEEEEDTVLRCYTSRKVMMDDVVGLRSDLEELESFLGLCKRPAVRRVLTDACQQLRGRIQQVEQLTKSSPQTPASTEVFNTIDRFAWDQTPDFVKVYVHLDGLGALPAEATSATFEEKSAELTVRNLRHKNYALKFQPLYAPIDPQKSNFSVKKDSVTLRLAKLRSGEHWDSIAQPVHQRNAIPPPDLSSDPSESIMTMMKSLYNQGDSEMKRTIAKAWTESHEKKSKGVPVDDGLF